MQWSKPVPCDLTRTNKRVSVPRENKNNVPQSPGVYVIIRLDQSLVQDRILDIGMAGPRGGMGLRGRVASCVEHSAFQKIALAINENNMDGKLKLVWVTTDTGLLAKSLEESMLALFYREFARVPLYNGNGGKTANPDVFQADYDALKQHIVAL
jgi:hypothetical protein